jgi:hypothetical protein
MNGLADMLLRVFLTVSVVIFSIPVAYGAVPLLPLCSWPVESTGQGFLNVATQDTNTTYWFMPIDTSRWKSVTIHGTYPNARLFNYATYGPTGLLIDTLLDEDIIPDNGSANPFTTATAAGSNTYTVTVKLMGKLMRKQGWADVETNSESSREKLTRIASNPNETARMPFPRKLQLTEPKLCFGVEDSPQ